MQKRIALWLGLLIAVAVFASVVIRAQTKLLPREYRIVSGTDVGFRIEGTDLSGKPMGTWMVRVDGQWVEISAAPVTRRLHQP